MSFPTWSTINQQVLGKLDDPNGSIFTPAVFQVGLNEAYDVLYSAFLAAQLPRIETVVYITVPVGTTQLTPAQMGISSFGDFVYLSERTLGSNDRYIDLEPVDRLSQRVPFERLQEFNYRDGTFFFIGATTNRQLEVKYDSSGAAPVSDGTAPTKDAQITVDSCQNFLSNYTVGVIGSRKGYDEIAADCRGLAVGPRFNTGTPGGQLFALLQPLIRSRQNVQVARRPFSARRRMGIGWLAAPQIGVQQGTTGGSVNNVPIQYSTANGTILPAPDGVTTVFVLITGVTTFAVVSLNGVTLTLGIDYTILGNQVTLIGGVIPTATDTITCEAYAATQS